VRRECLDRMLIFGESSKFFLLMRRITIKRARTWHYRKMHPCTEQSNGLASLSPFRSWPDCIINTSGYDFRKGQVEKSAVTRIREVEKHADELAQRMESSLAKTQELQRRAEAKLK
jgi:hypothetical protein